MLFDFSNTNLMQDTIFVEPENLSLIDENIQIQLFNELISDNEEANFFNKMIDYWSELVLTGKWQPKELEKQQQLYDLMTTMSMEYPYHNVSLSCFMVNKIVEKSNNNLIDFQFYLNNYLKFVDTMPNVSIHQVFAAYDGIFFELLIQCDWDMIKYFHLVDFFYYQEMYPDDVKTHSLSVYPRKINWEETILGQKILLALDCQQNPRKHINAVADISQWLNQQHQNLDLYNVSFLQQFYQKVIDNQITLRFGKEYIPVFHQNLLCNGQELPFAKAINDFKSMNSALYSDVKPNPRPEKYDVYTFLEKVWDLVS